MTDANPPVPAGPGPTADAVQRELDALNRLVRDVRHLQAVGRSWVYVTTLLVVVLFGLFTWWTYARVKRNFGPDDVQVALNQHWQEMQPQVQKLMQATSENVLPAYRDAVVATLKARGPKAAEAAVAKLRALPERAGKEFQAKMAAAFDAAVKRVEPEVRDAFPNVPDERRQQVLQAFAIEQINSQNKRVAARVDQLYTNDLIRMQAVLGKFDLPESDPAHGGPAELERRFLHTMVALLDDQVDAAYAVPTLDPSRGKPTRHTRGDPAAVPAVAVSTAQPAADRITPATEPAAVPPIAAPTTGPATAPAADH